LQPVRRARADDAPFEVELEKPLVIPSIIASGSSIVGHKYVEVFIDVKCSTRLPNNLHFDAIDLGD